MFIDQEGKQSIGDDGSLEAKKHKLIAFGIIILALVIFGLSLFFVYISLREPPELKIVIDPNTNIGTSTDQIAPINQNFLQTLNSSNLNGNNSSSSLSDLSLEKYSFGDFFEVDESKIEYGLKNYTLPINIKSDTYNYYDLARKINLDSYVENLNNNGFAIADNQFKTANDFYKFNQEVIKNEIPIVISDDFLIYYFQNVLKKVNKDIEKNVFYDNVWNLSKAMYDKASARYRNNLFEKGIINDPSLEAQRLEASFFAVALELLEPKESQINRILNFDDESKFSEQQADFYSYALQDFLREEVEREVALIKDANLKSKSHILLYEKDYTVFKVPSEYKSNARLYNFYLASKWLESLFPLFYKSDECPDCLLDIDDWSISMATAGYISNDLGEDQDLKNQWANIYKFLSFFKGLRRDLTYLMYEQAYKDVYGDASPEETFARSNANRLNQLSQFQSILAGTSFSELEGGYIRKSENFSKIGLRLLSEHYWPNDFLFNKLTGENLAYEIKENQPNPKYSGCRKTVDLGRGEKETYYYKCKGSASEIINLIYPLESNLFVEEAFKYNGYQNNFEYLEGLVNDFSNYSWHANYYWTTVDMINKNLNQKFENLAAYTNSELWDQKEINTSLGMWTNIHLEKDELSPNPSKALTSFAYEENCQLNNYIIPNLNLVRNMIANVNMLSKMMEITDLTRKTNIVAIEMTDMLSDLEFIESIILKELKGQAFEKNDCNFIRDFSQKYELINDGENTFELNLSKAAKVEESISGVKMLILVTGYEDNKSIMLGPLFNYNEK